MIDNRPRGGRGAQAAANDETILLAAREVFLADPSAPIAAVAQRAGVGISALYRRYPSKQELVATLCAIGQQTYLAEVERALALDSDPWDAWVQWLRRIVDADTHALVVRLAGTFTPTAAHLERAERIRVLGNRLFSRAKAARAFRPGLTFLDVNLLLEMVSTTRLGDAARSAEMRRRYLDVVIAGMSSGSAGRLAGRPPMWQEESARWLTQ
jgi:AcrR family transcriptional regulator